MIFEMFIIIGDRMYLKQDYKAYITIFEIGSAKGPEKLLKGS